MGGKEEERKNRRSKKTRDDIGDLEQKKERKDNVIDYK